MNDNDQGERSSDPLTKDLPGLPIEFRNVRIDETGFHRTATRFRSEAHFTWEQVKAVRAGVFAVVVEGRREPDDRVRALARSWASKAKIKQAGDAWKEYRLRALEQRGTIRGSCDLPAPRYSCRVLVGYGLLFVFIGALSMYLWGMVRDELVPTGTGFRGAVAVEAAEMESVADDDDGPPPSAFRGVPMGSAWATESEADDDGLSFSTVLSLKEAVSAFQCIAGLSLVLMALVELRMMRRWNRWELSREGFAFWPDGKRQTLDFPQKISMGLWRFRHFRLGRERNTQIQAAAVAWPLFLALNERLGGSVRWRLAWDMTGAAIVSAALWALVIWETATRGRSGESVIGFLMAAVLTVVLFAAPVSIRGIHKRALAEGREMLKRLGW